MQKRSEHSLFRAVGWWGNVLIFIAAAWQLVLLVTLVYVRYGTMGEDRAGHTFPLFMLVWSSLVITVPASAVALMKASYAWGDQIGATWFYFSVAALPLLVFSAFFLL